MITLEKSSTICEPHFHKVAEFINLHDALVCAQMFSEEPFRGYAFRVLHDCGTIDSVFVNGIDRTEWGDW